MKLAVWFMFCKVWQFAYKTLHWVSCNNMNMFLVKWKDADKSVLARYTSWYDLNDRDDGCHGCTQVLLDTLRCWDIYQRRLRARAPGFSHSPHMWFVVLILMSPWAIVAKELWEQLTTGMRRIHFLVMCTHYGQKASLCPHTVTVSNCFYM